MLFVCLFLFQNTATERDDYRKKFVEVEKKLKDLLTSYDAITSEDGNDVSLRKEVDDLKKNLNNIQSLLEDKVRIIINQENQINALNNQVSSLKEVVQITKDLLNIRNLEVKHLQVKKSFSYLYHLVEHERLEQKIEFSL